MDSPASCPDRGDVRVWYARPGAAWAAPGARVLALEWLTPAERTRYDRYRHDADRDMFLLGRAMARVLVARALGVAPTAWVWRDGARGRPEIGAPPCPLSFNLAHSGGLVVCALARDTQVGVDVEDRARAALDRQLVTRYCSPAERVAIDACGDNGWQDAFLRHWTLKEAYLKARGLGIAVPLADLSFAIGDDPARGIDRARVRLTFEGSLAGEDPQWTFAIVPVGDRHYVAAAVATGNGQQPRFTFAPMPEAWLPA